MIVTNSIIYILKMAFWALGALDKMKNITENLNIKNVKKVISYVVIPIVLRLLKANLGWSHRKIQIIYSIIRNRTTNHMLSQRKS